MKAGDSEDRGWSASLGAILMEVTRNMRKPKRSTREIKAEIENLRSQMKSAETAEEAEFGRMARKAGLLDLDLDDKQLKEAIDEIVLRFRGADASQPANAKVGGGETSSRDREANASAST